MTETVPVHLARAPAAVLSLSLPLALASLQPFRIGYWDKAEPLIVGLHLAGGLGGLALVLCLWLAPRPTMSRLCHPLVLLPLAMALWSVIALPFVPMPVLSLLGAPQSGTGALWHLDMAVLIACGLVVRDHPGIWRLLGWEAVAVTLAVAGLKLADNLGDDLNRTLLLYVAAYYGWIGLALPIAARPWDWRRGDWPFAVTAAVAALACVASARSMTAWLVVGFGAALLIACRWAWVARLAGSRRFGGGLVAAVALLPPVVLYWLGGLSSNPSLRDRLHLQEMMLAAFGQDSFSWIFGQGWGRIQDAFQAHLNVTGENLWQPTWIFLSSDYFSAHCWVLDTLHGVGLVGVLIQLAAFIAIPVFASAPARPAAIVLGVAYALVSAVWFQLAFAVPFFAMAMATVAAAPREVAVRRPFPGLAGGGLMALGLAQLGCAAFLVAQGQQIGAMRRDFAQAAQAPHAWPADIRESDQEASAIIRDTFHLLAEAKVRRPEMVPVARSMLDYLKRRIPETGTVQLVSVGLGAMTYLHFSRELAWLVPELGDTLSLWRPWLDRLLRLAPGRTDMAIGYLTDRAVAGDLATVRAMSEAFLARDADDAVGLYFRGLVLVLDPNPEVRRAGIQAFRSAERAGIERFLPLDPAIRRLMAGA